MSDTDEREGAGRAAGADPGREEGLTGILQALQEAVEHARAMPMSSSVLVSRAELLDLVEQAREVLPAQLGQADEVLAGAEDVLSRARAEAEAIVDDARRRAEELVGHEHVVVQARARAEEIVAEAERRAVQARRDADDWCDRRLADFEIDLGRVLSQVRSGRGKLAERLADDAG